MHYLILRNIVETTLQHFRCSQCGSPGNEAAVSVESVAGGAVDLKAACPSCGATVQIHAAVHAVGDKMPLTLSRRDTPESSPEPLIKDKDVIELSRDLGSCTSLKDLLQ